MRTRIRLALGNFFSAAHFFLIIYIFGPYLSTLMPEQSIGFVISAGAVITLTVFPFMSRLVARFGPRRLATYGAIAEMFILLGLATAPPIPIIGMALVALAAALSPLVVYQLDLLLEATVAHEGTTVRIRTAFLTAGNLALIIAPLLVGFLLGASEQYERVFLVAAASLLPFIALFMFDHIPEGLPPRVCDIRDTAKCLIWDKDMRAIMFANLVLQLFYHTAPLYISLYLHSVIGIPWSTLGWMFMIMVLPFVLVEYPAAELSERWFGDKELMATGFVVMGIAFATIGFLGAHTELWFILAILVASRIGAALVEAMSEGHFFRRVSETDAATVSLYRMARPAAALTAPLFGSALLVLGGYTVLFAVLGITVAVLGAIAAFLITDVR